MKNKLLILFILLTWIGFTPAYSNELEDATVYYNEAIDLYKQDDVERSIELFNKALELAPDFYEAHYNLAQILMSIDKNEQALKSLEQIIKLKPDDAETLYNLGKIQYKRGYLSKSHGYLSKIPQTAPQYESAHVLIQKIEKRQKELNIEAQIKDSKPQVDTQGKAKGVDLAEFDSPSGVIIDPRGNIYVASFSENTIYKITIYGQKSTPFRTNMIKGPIGLAMDKTGNIYVANYSANNIAKINPQGQASIFADVQKPYCIIYDGEHNRLYVTEQGTNQLLKFDL